MIAAMAAEAAPGLQVRLVESDQRKAAFLRAVIQAAGRPGDGARLRGSRACRRRQADVVSARALAPLDDLLAMVEKHRAARGYWLVSEGRDGA